ncbi:MAG: hypothetical protein R2828_16015 [Saprospiraceae bacterium]
MSGKKIISLLQTFSRQDKIRFQKWLQSPFFNEDPQLLALFDQLEPIINGASEVDKKRLWQAVFGKSPYEDIALRRIFSNLLAQAYHFLSIKQYQSHPLRQKIDLLPLLTAPELATHYAGLVRNIEQSLAQGKKEEDDFHYSLYRLTQNTHKSKELTGDLTESCRRLEKADFHFDQYYFIQKLKHYCDALGYRNFISEEVDIKLLPGMMQYLKAQAFFDDLLIKAYYLVTEMLNSPEKETAFFQLKHLLFKKCSALPTSELKTLFIHLYNYCIHKKINIGETGFFSELFEIYQFALANGIIYNEEGELVPQDYKNIITVGLHVEAFDWVENFIKEQTQDLPTDQRQNALTYNLAKVYFSRKQYEKVITQLQEVEYDDIVYALGSKLMLLKTYYELDEFLALDSLIDSFRIYLRRNKTISTQVKRQYLNILRFVKKMSAIGPYDTHAFKKLYQQAEDCKALADKRWILDKIKTLGRWEPLTNN